MLGIATFLEVQCTRIAAEGFSVLRCKEGAAPPSVNVTRISLFSLAESSHGDSILLPERLEVASSFSCVAFKLVGMLC